jgi:hypothetical protein
MCIQFFLEYQHCSHHHYLGEQHCSDSLLCVRNAPLIYRLRHTNAAPGPPPSQPSDPSVSYPLTTCEICLSTLGEQLDPEQVPVQYYPPSNNFDVKLRQDAAFGRFVRVEEDRSDAKSLSDIDSDDEDCDASGGGGAATHEYYNPTTALKHQALLDTQLYNLPYWIAQLYNLPYWIAHQQAHGVGAHGQVQYWYTPWGVVAVNATQDNWVGEGLIADGTSAAPLPPRKQRKSQSHGSSKMTNSHSRKQSKHSQSEHLQSKQPRSKLPQPKHPQSRRAESRRAESKHSQSGRSESNPSESNPPESNASESGPSESSRSSDRSTPPTVASIKPLAPLRPRFMRSTAFSSSLPLDTQTPLENPGGPTCASSLPPLLMSSPTPQQDLPQAGRDPVLFRAPRKPRADRRSKRPRLDHLPDRQVTLEHYLVQTKRKPKGNKEQRPVLMKAATEEDTKKENSEEEMKDGGDAIAVLLDKFELETETETGTGMEVEGPIEKVGA